MRVRNRRAHRSADLGDSGINVDVITQNRRRTDGSVADRNNSPHPGRAPMPGVTNCRPPQMPSFDTVFSGGLDAKTIDSHQGRPRAPRVVRGDICAFALILRAAMAIAAPAHRSRAGAVSTDQEGRGIGIAF